MIRVCCRRLRSMAASLLFGGALVGCAGVEGLPRYYFLVASPPSLHRPSSRPGSVQVLVRPAQMPLYLFSGDVAVRTQGNQFIYLPGARWAEPLDRGIARAIAENLENRGVRAAVMAVAGASVQAQYVLSVRIGKFEGSDWGEVITEVQWDLSRPDDGRPLVSRQERTVAASWVSGDVSSLVNALSGQLGEVSRRIAPFVSLR